jgi:mono/diheme cytochrome c family protein
LLAGCGGASTPPARTGESGKTLFTRQCGACHRLADAGTQGSVAVDLDELRPSRGRVLRAIADGPSSMPAGLVAGADAQTVAAYVASATRR